MFDHLKKRIVPDRHKYFPNDPQNLVLVAIEKVITTNTKRNPRAVMARNVSFSITTQDNYQYLLNENYWLRK